MSLKPEVARVSGVHSVTNSSQEGDIGFPQLQLEKLFEAATVKELASGAEYTKGKKYAYLNPNWKTDPNKYLSIENEAHFHCVRDGYCGLDGSVDHYYTKEGDDYKYNAVPPTGSWEAKLSFSDAIKDKELYSISKEEERIYIDGGYYIKKENDGYKRQGDTVYIPYEKAGEIDWSENNKYKRKSQLVKDEEGNPIRDLDGELVYTYIWQNNDNVLAKSGYYVSVHELDSNTYTARIINIGFSAKGVWSSGLEQPSASLYKLDSEELVYGANIKDGDELAELRLDYETVFAADPADFATDNFIYINYEDNASWTYPNDSPPKNGTLLLVDVRDGRKWRSYNPADFPLFTEVALTEIEIKSELSKPIYEKLAVTVNYKYSGNNNLKFIFTNKSVPEVLDVCSLNNPDISKYVHLTNLEYTTDMA